MADGKKIQFDEETRSGWLIAFILIGVSCWGTGLLMGLLLEGFL